MHKGLGLPGIGDDLFTAARRRACAWTERSQSQARRRLETVRDKLKRPAELHRLLPGNGRRFERLKQWLHDVRDAESAVDSLEKMARLLRAVLEAPAS